VLGIDASYTCTGLVVLDSSFKVITSSGIRIPTGPGRMLRAGKALHLFIGDLTKSCVITKSVIEDAAYGAPSRITVAKLMQLTGVFKFILEAHNIDWLELSPSSAKKWITGKGNAEKHVVAQEIKAQFGIQFQNDKGFDLSDATALAIWGVKHL
jgi:Holliday junction resolvasome RuvABC endonuclease subunit